MRFTLFGFPVRVHPLFLLGPTLFGKGLIAGEGIIGVRWLIVVAVFFVSILFHELGHAWAHRYFGMGSRIVLYWMGGLAIRERNPWMSGGHRVAGEAHSQQMVISLAGPVASVVLVIAMIGLGVAIGGALLWGRILVFPLPWLDFSETVFRGNHYFKLLFNATILLNLFWAILNMLPVFPLDGGQLARAFFQKIDPVDGLKNSLYLSIGAAALIAVFALSIEDMFLVIFFGFMAYQSWQSLQQFSGRRW